MTALRSPSIPRRPVALINAIDYMRGIVPERCFFENCPANEGRGKHHREDCDRGLALAAVRAVEALARLVYGNARARGKR